MAGRIGHKPTEDSRKLVKALMLLGLSQARIGEHLGLSEKPLRRHYRAELDFSSERMLGNIAQNLAQLAQGADAVAVSAARFVLASRAGWRTDETRPPVVNVTISGDDARL